MTPPPPRRWAGNAGTPPGRRCCKSQLLQHRPRRQRGPRTRQGGRAVLPQTTGRGAAARGGTHPVAPSPGSAARALQLLEADPVVAAPELAAGAALLVAPVVPAVLVAPVAPLVAVPAVELLVVVLLPGLVAAPQPAANAAAKATGNALRRSAFLWNVIPSPSLPMPVRCRCPAAPRCAGAPARPVCALCGHRLLPFDGATCTRPRRPASSRWARPGGRRAADPGRELPALPRRPRIRPKGHRGRRRPWHTSVAPIGPRRGPPRDARGPGAGAGIHAARPWVAAGAYPSGPPDRLAACCQELFPHP